MRTTGATGVEHSIELEHDTPSQAPTSSFDMPFPSPQRITTTYRPGDSSPSTTYSFVDDTAATRLKAQSSCLEDKVRDLDEMVRMFRTKIKGVSRDFQTFKTDVDQLAHEFDALEDDHRRALASLEEEKSTATRWLGLLRNREKELFIVYQNLEGHPDESDLVAGCFSQVTTLDPIFDRTD
jgi:outer membrane murein-binding lipoprotein Lpp